jgi:hypothetical protein
MSIIVSADDAKLQKKKIFYSRMYLWAGCPEAGEAVMRGGDRLTGLLSHQPH